LVIFFSSEQPALILTNFSVFSHPVSDVGPYQTIVEKIHPVNVELAGHAHKLDMKLQKLCGSGFSPFAVHMRTKHHHFDGVN